MKTPYIVYFNTKTGKELVSYSLKGTFKGEMQATTELIMSENGLSEKDISVELFFGKGPYVLGKGRRITEENILFSEDKFDKLLVYAIKAQQALPDEKVAILTYVGTGDFDCPVYKDENGVLFVDINIGKGEPDLYSLSPNEIDGEPNNSINCYYDRVTFKSKYKRNPRSFDYQMLGRLKSDCEYALYAAKNSGKLFLDHLYYKSVKDHIAEMKKLYNSFSDSEKPEWLTLGQINDYEVALNNML